MHTVITTAHQTVHNSLCCDSSTGLAVWPYPEETTYGTLNPDTSVIFMLHFSDLNKKVERRERKEETGLTFSGEGSSESVFHWLIATSEFKPPWYRILIFLETGANIN